MLGAGGAARGALGPLLDQLRPAALVIANRTVERATQLAAEFADLGAVRGVSYPIRGFFAGLGPIAAGVVWDLSGAYSLAFAVMLCGCLLSAALMLTVQRPVKRALSVG